jgi:hypothetical protein
MLNSWYWPSILEPTGHSGTLYHGNLLAIQAHCTSLGEKVWYLDPINLLYIFLHFVTFCSVQKMKVPAMLASGMCWHQSKQFYLLTATILPSPCSSLHQPSNFKNPSMKEVTLYYRAIFCLFMMISSTILLLLCLLFCTASWVKFWTCHFNVYSHQPDNTVS